MKKIDSPFIVVVCGIGTIALGLLIPSEFTGLTWWRLLLNGFFAFIVLNITLFSVNLLKSLKVARKAKSEDEVEQILVPALRAENTKHISEMDKLFTRVITRSLLGVFLGAAIVLLIRK